MAKGTIKQRIALEGGDEIKKELLELGRAGEVVWAKLNAQSKKLQPPTAFNKGIETLKRSFADLSKFSDQLRTSFGRVSQSWDDLGNAASRMTQRIGLITAGVTAAVTGLALLAKTSADSADSLLENAERAGMSAKAFQTLSAVASLSGVSQETLARGLLNLNKQLAETTAGANKFVTNGLQPVKDAAARIKEGFAGSGANVVRFGQDLAEVEGEITDTTQALKELGIVNVEAFKNLSNEDKLIAIADGMARVGDEAKRTTIAAQLLGKGGLQILPFLSQGGEAIRKLVEEFRALGLELDETQLRTLAEASDQFAKVGIAATRLRDQIVAAFAPALIQGSNALLALIAQNRAAIQQFATWLGAEASKALRDFINILTGKDVPRETTWVQTWIDNIKTFASTVQGAVTNIIIPMFNTLMSALTQVSKVLNDVFGFNLTGEQLGIVLLIAQVTGALGLLVPAILLAQAAWSAFIFLMTSGPWGPIALAIAGLAALIIAHWDEIKAAGAAVWEVIKSAATAAFADIKQLWTDVTGFIVSSVGGIVSAIQTVIDALTAAIAYARQLASTPVADPNLPDVRGEGFARGGYVRGRGSSTSDSILARLSDGEFVIAARAVRKYGPNLLRAINAMVLPKLPGFAKGGLAAAPTFKLGLPSFALGGLVDGLTAGFSPRITLPRLAMAGASAGRVPANIHFGGESYEVSATEDVLQRMGRAAVRQKMTSGGRKPGWYGS
jgi:methyl-accepting chemotaxis protein